MCKRTSSTCISNCRFFSDKRGLVILIVFFIALSFPATFTSASAPSQMVPHLVEPGDTWLALSLRYNLAQSVLRNGNSTINQQREPVIGTELSIPLDTPAESTGLLINIFDGGLLRSAIRFNSTPWKIALENDLVSPSRPLLYRAILIPDDTAQIRQLPNGIDKLELSQSVARPGEALALRASGSSAHLANVQFNREQINVFVNKSRLIGLFGTGAFFLPGQYDLTFNIEGDPLWSQPWLVAPGTWSFEDITLTGSAAEIDSQSIQAEYERLSLLWAVSTPEPLWDSDFSYPIENFLAISSEYGTRRSYNGGPYRSYHEGLDFSAYGGTPVFAVARGKVVLAERLYVRGGAVIIDHGLGVYSGAYHMNETSVLPDQIVERGRQIGQVGSTGLSTGNHLHWDLLVNGTWVNPAAWYESDIDSWLLDWWQEATNGS